MSRTVVVPCSYPVLMRYLLIMLLSIIIPVLNEAETIAATLRFLQPLRNAGHEVILIDGGSQDNTVTIAKPYVDQLHFSSPGRANQMNTGAALAQGDILLFLHADTQLPPHCDQLIPANCIWGRFDIALDSSRWYFRMIANMINWRSRLSGIATGDQAIFVRRDIFAAIGGYPALPLFEDIALSQLLRRKSTPCCLRAKVITSSRRWQRRGVVKTILLMWFLRAAYYLGISPQRLAGYYAGK